MNIVDFTIVDFTMKKKKKERVCAVAMNGIDHIICTFISETPLFYFDNEEYTIE